MSVFFYLLCKKSWIYLLKFFSVVYCILLHIQRSWKVWGYQNGNICSAFDRYIPIYRTMEGKENERYSANVRKIDHTGGERIGFHAQSYLKCCGCQDEGATGKRSSTYSSTPYIKKMGGNVIPDDSARGQINTIPFSTTFQSLCFRSLCPLFLIQRINRISGGEWILSGSEENIALIVL